jgi:hypothetical protein
MGGGRVLEVWLGLVVVWVLRVGLPVFP